MVVLFIAAAAVFFCTLICLLGFLFRRRRTAAKMQSAEKLAAEKHVRLFVGPPGTTLVADWKDLNTFALESLEIQLLHVSLTDLQPLPSAEGLPSPPPSPPAALVVPHVLMTRHLRAEDYERGEYRIMDPKLLPGHSYQVRLRFHVLGKKTTFEKLSALVTLPIVHPPESTHGVVAERPLEAFVLQTVRHQDEMGKVLEQQIVMHAVNGTHDFRTGVTAGGSYLVRIRHKGRSFEATLRVPQTIGCEFSHFIVEVGEIGEEGFLSIQGEAISGSLNPVQIPFTARAQDTLARLYSVATVAHDSAYEIRSNAVEVKLPPQKIIRFEAFLRQREGGADATSFQVEGKGAPTHGRDLNACINLRWTWLDAGGTSRSSTRLAHESNENDADGLELGPIAVPDVSWMPQLLISITAHDDLMITSSDIQAEWDQPKVTHCKLDQVSLHMELREASPETKPALFTGTFKPISEGGKHPVSILGRPKDAAPVHKYTLHSFAEVSIEDVVWSIGHASQELSVPSAKKPQQVQFHHPQYQRFRVEWKQSECSECEVVLYQVALRAQSSETGPWNDLDMVDVHTHKNTSNEWGPIGSSSLQLRVLSREEARIAVQIDVSKHTLTHYSVRIRAIARTQVRAYGDVSDQGTGQEQYYIFASEWGTPDHATPEKLGLDHSLPDEPNSGSPRTSHPGRQVESLDPTKATPKKLGLDLDHDLDDEPNSGGYLTSRPGRWREDSLAGGRLSMISMVPPTLHLKLTLEAVADPLGPEWEGAGQATATVKVSWNNHNRSSSFKLTPSFAKWDGNTEPSPWDNMWDNQRPIELREEELKHEGARTSVELANIVHQHPGEWCRIRAHAETGEMSEPLLLPKVLPPETVECFPVQQPESSGASAHGSSKVPSSRCRVEITPPLCQIGLAGDVAPESIGCRLARYLVQVNSGGFQGADEKQRSWYVLDLDSMVAVVHRTNNSVLTTLSDNNDGLKDEISVSKTTGTLQIMIDSNAQVGSDTVLSAALKADFSAALSNAVPDVTFQRENSSVSPAVEVMRPAPDLHNAVSLTLSFPSTINGESGVDVISKYVSQMTDVILSQIPGLTASDVTIRVTVKLEFTAMLRGREPWFASVASVGLVNEELTNSTKILSSWATNRPRPPPPRAFKHELHSFDIELQFDDQMWEGLLFGKRATTYELELCDEKGNPINGSKQMLKVRIDASRIDTNTNAVTREESKLNLQGQTRINQGNRKVRFATAEDQFEVELKYVPSPVPLTERMQSRTVAVGGAVSERGGSKLKSVNILKGGHSYSVRYRGLVEGQVSEWSVASNAIMMPAFEKEIPAPKLCLVTTPEGSTFDSSGEQLFTFEASWEQVPQPTSSRRRIAWQQAVYR